MDISGSFLKTVVERIRGYLDEPEFDAKYTDQFITQHVVMPALVDVWSRVSLNADNPVVLDCPITFVENQSCYVLPSCVGEVLEVVQYPTTSIGMPEFEIIPRDRMNLKGENWSIQGNMICFVPFPSLEMTTNSWVVKYTSNGDMCPHYSGVGALSSQTINGISSLRGFTLAATPDLGILDKRENCYAGQILRILSGTVFQERVIESYDANSRLCILKRPFVTPIVAAGSFIYEVAPNRSQGMVEAVAIACALKLGTWRKISQAQMAMLTQQYRSSIKTIGDNMSNLQQRTGKTWMKGSRDDPHREY